MTRSTLVEKIAVVFPFILLAIFFMAPKSLAEDSYDSVTTCKCIGIASEGTTKWDGTCYGLTYACNTVLK